ncbi:hypothetical protein MASR2M15_15510 [Anaerolineales bacterium]
MSSSEEKQVINDIHHVGSSSENVFSRLYQLLHRRQEATEPKEPATVKKVASPKQKLLDAKQHQIRNEVSRKDNQIRHFYSLFMHITEGIIIFDHNDQIVLINEPARALFGSQRALWDSPLGATYRELDREQRLSAEISPLCDLKLDLDKKIFDARFIGLADVSGHQVGTVILLRDITQDELRERIKRGFVTHITHELRTPLAVMRVASEVLINQSENEPANRRMVELLNKNVDVLNTMITEMIDVSRMTSGQFEIHDEAINMEDLLLRMHGEFETILSKEGLKLLTIIRNINLLYVQGDKHHLGWAIQNLIRNSIMYKDDSELIVIRAFIREDAEQTWLMIEVEDSGAGISEEDLPHVFEHYYRGKPYTRKGKVIDKRGLGQGLYVSQQIVQAHGGEIQVESEFQVGTIVSIKLPAQINNQLPDPQQ